MQQNLIHLFNEKISVDISSFGAEIKSIKKQGNSFEYIWQAGVEWQRSAPILFPIIGREDGDGIIIDGRKYSINAHGFARDSNFTVVSQSNTEAIFQLTNSDISIQNFPYEFVFKVKYQIIGSSITQEFLISNKSSNTFYYSVGGHPAFNLVPENLEEYYFEFNGIETVKMLAIKDNLLTGEEKNVRINNKIELSNEIFKDGVLVIENSNSQISSVTLSSKNQQYKVEFSNIDKFTYLGIWAKYNCHKFICFEPWLGITGTVNQYSELKNKKGILKLDANQEQKVSFSMNFF